MTVPSETNRSGPYNGNGVTTVFSYGFRIVDEDHLRVIRTSALGVETVLTIDSDYIVSDVGEPGGGQIALTVAPATGETITILRAVPFTQETDLENQGAYYAETVEDAFDLAAMRDQQLSEEVDRAVKIPASYGGGADLQLPTPEGNKFIAWNEAGNGLRNVSATELATISAYGTARADIFTGDGVTVDFTLSASPGVLNNLDVAMGGVTQLPGIDYTWAEGTTITFTQAPPDGVKVLARYMNALELGTVLAEDVIGLGDPGAAALVGTLEGSVQAALNARIIRVTSRTAVKALNVTRHGVAFLDDNLIAGAFVLKTGAPPADPLEGVYLVSDTAGYYWQRVYDGFPRAEWWGAVLDDGNVDSAPALQACLDVTGRLYFPRGYYYGSAGLNGNGKVVHGDGPLVSGYICSSPTDHILSNAGTTSAFEVGGDFRDFALARSAAPTTPASADDDRTQGHGLHLDLVSNPRVHNVYTYNNLVEVYVARTLAAQLGNLRGIRQAGGAGDRWTGLYVFGDPAGMPDGWSAGPSGNPSCTIKKVQMSARAEVGSSTCFKLYKHLQDLWIEDPEAGGGHVQFDIATDSTTAGDVFIVRPVADAYRTHGIRITNLPLGANLTIEDAWIAPSATATGSGVILNGAHGLTMSVKGDFLLASGLRGVDATDSSRMSINANISNSQYPCVATSVNSSEFNVRGFKAIDGANFGDVVTSFSCQGCSFDVATVAVGTQKYERVLNIDAGSSGLCLNVTRTYAGSAAARIFINGSAVTTQGNVSGHVIINPGAGAML